MLDAMLTDDDPEQVLHSEDLLMELRKRLTERILDAEMDVHLTSTDDDNTRNCHNRKTVLTTTDPMPLETPRDRQGSFTPKLVPKHVRRMPGFDDKVLAIFAKAMSVHDIRQPVAELYGIELSPELIATVTDAMMEEFAACQNRPLESTYTIVYLDAIQVKVRDAGSVVHRAVYLGIGIAQHGHRTIARRSGTPTSSPHCANRAWWPPQHIQL